MGRESRSSEGCENDGAEKRGEEVLTHEWLLDAEGIVAEGGWNSTVPTRSGSSIDSWDLRSSELKRRLATERGTPPLVRVAGKGLKVARFSVSCEWSVRVAGKGVTGTVASGELKRNEVTGVDL